MRIHLLCIKCDDTNIPGLDIFVQQLADVRVDLVDFVGVVPRGWIWITAASAPQAVENQGWGISTTWRQLASHALHQTSLFAVCWGYHWHLWKFKIGQYIYIKEHNPPVDCRKTNERLLPKFLAPFGSWLSTWWSAGGWSLEWLGIGQAACENLWLYRFYVSMHFD